MGQRSDAKMRDGMRAPDFREEARRSAQGQSPDSVSEPLKKVDQALLASREARARQKTPANVRLYQAAHRNYRIQVTCPEDRLDLRTGHKITARPIAAKFDNYMLEIRIDREPGRTILHKIEGCPEECEDHDFERHPNYGIGRSFWDAQEMVQLASSSRTKKPGRGFSRTSWPESWARRSSSATRVKPTTARCTMS